MITAMNANTYMIGYADLHCFMRGWPCHNIPDDVGAVCVWFASNGDLMDLIYLRDEDDDRSIVQLTDEQENDCGAAMVAIVADVQAYWQAGTLARWML